MIAVGKVTEPMGEAYLILSFTHGTVCHVQEMQKLRFRMPCAALNNIRCNRDRRAPNLRRKSKLFFPRKLACRPVHRQDQFIGEFERS